jgi:nitroreductase
MMTQRAIRRFQPDSIPIEDLHLIVDAAVKAPNGGNQQRGRFVLVDDRDSIRNSRALYREAWWAKRLDEGFHDLDDLPPRYLPAAGLADAMADEPCVVSPLRCAAARPIRSSPPCKTRCSRHARSASVRCRRRCTRP